MRIGGLLAALYLAGPSRPLGKIVNEPGRVGQHLEVPHGVGEPQSQRLNPD